MIIIFTVFLVTQFLLINANVDKSTLHFVFAMFRHGHRTNDYKDTYPNDPYKNITYYPYGWGQLTNEGKMREFELGKKLRARYGDFVGMYTPDVIEPISTNVNRTKMSLQLVLAGLFPPNDELLWNKELLWQPIPYNYIEMSDVRYGTLLPSCENRQKMFTNFIQTPEGNLLYNRHAKWYNYVSKHTGLDIRNGYDLAQLYFGLSVEKEVGLKLPDWVTPVYPDILKSSAIDAYHVLSATDELAKLGQGFLLKNWLDVSAQKIDGKLNPITRKIILVASHEVHIASLLITLKAFDNDVPPYGSCVMIELHKIDGEYGFKIYYEKHTGGPPNEITIPGCEHFCTIAKIKNILSKRIPESYDLC